MIHISWLLCSSNCEFKDDVAWVDPAGSVCPSERVMLQFPNDWGASVIVNKVNGPFEVGVRYKGTLDYDNPVANGDTITNLDWPGVKRVLRRIKDLDRPIK